MADGILTNDISIESSWLCLFNGVISFFWFSHLKNCQVSPTEKIYIEPIYSQFTCLSDNLFRSEQFFMEQARDTGTRISIIMYIHIYNSFVKVWWYHLCRYRYYCSVSCSTDKQTISTSSRSNFAWLMTKHNKIQTVSVIPTKTSQGYKWCWGQIHMVPDQTCRRCLTIIIFYNSFLRYC